MNIDSIIENYFDDPKKVEKFKNNVAFSVGPLIREIYQNKYIQKSENENHKEAIIVGVVNNREKRLLERKGYNVTMADLFPVNSSILKLDLTNPDSAHYEKYDLAVISDVLEHIDDHFGAVDGTYKLLKIGGSAYFHTPGGNWNSPLTKHDIKHGHVRRGYSEDQIKQVINSTTFSQVKYLKTFNTIETGAYKLAKMGQPRLAIELIKESNFDGSQGGSHLFLCKK